jgi:hypothetical protein
MRALVTVTHAAPRHLAASALAALALSAAPALAGPAQFVIVNANAPGVGFNDPTPVAPVGGNTGTTLGEQRLIAFTHAAGIWSARLDSAVPIVISAQFTSLGTNVLGSAGPRYVTRDFPNAPLAGTWYHAALANKLAGVDLQPTLHDINANFSSDFNFYLGLDNNHGPLNDLVAVLLHEFAHGLGFSQTASLTTGALNGGFPDHYNTHLLDTTLGLRWPEMTDAQRLASATRFGRVVWDGVGVTAAVPTVLSLGSPTVEVNSPASLAGGYQFGTASFGPRIGSPSVTADIVEAVDAVEAGVVGATSTDGCSPLANAGAIAGRIALVERGQCGFVVKARNATEAGAAAVIIYNNNTAANANAAPPGMAGDGINDAFVTVPTVSLRRADGVAIVAQLGGGVNADIGVDLTLRAGADASNRARVYAPFPVVGGSSISHFDTVASRNLLMEPAINPDLTHNVKAPFDLTWELLHDVGWTFPDADGDTFPDDEDCNAASDVRPTIILNGRDTLVPNRGLGSGCTMTDRIVAAKAASTSQPAFVLAVAVLTDAWRAAGLITTAQKATIQVTAGKWR